MYCSASKWVNVIQSVCKLQLCFLFIKPEIGAIGQGMHVTWKYVSAR
jgi:hypothetical protein